jgi:hypothetical protein
MGKWWEKKKEVSTVWQACQTPDGLSYYFNTVTNETTWEKPEELMTDDEKDSAGDWQWIPDEKHAFIPAKKMSETGAFSMLITEAGKEVKVKTKDIFPLKKSTLARVPEDLVLLDSMTGPLILHCLKDRFMQNKIYTNVGTILISMNPYQTLPIYTRAIIEKYMFRGVSEMPPHVFNIAHDAFKGLELGKNHSIIISGESGAGKTEATKRCLSYIAAIAGSVGGVEKKVLQANPILEAFGNAKTVRNDNSSRFGKYMELFFTEDDGRINGSQTTNYLLEKIRVCQQAPEERNYHIFYQLAKAPSIKKKHKLLRVEEYVYLVGGGCSEVTGIDDGREFADLEAAWKDLEFKQTEIDDIYQLVCGILTLGNVEFQGDSKASIKSMKPVEDAANLLQIPKDALVVALTSKELRIRGQPPMVKPLSGHQASDTRHALAKFIYGTLFDWLVKKINIAFGTSFNKKGKSVGLLDIFGFEIFEHNSFEQLCINFTNEMLQQHFNQQTFKLEEQVYKEQKITFDHVAFVDNAPMIALITQKPDGVLPLLDEELVVPRGSDQGFVGKLHDRQGKNKVYKKFLKNPDYFVIKHYAGEVTYDSGGWMDKNRDQLTMDLLEAVIKSKNSLLNTLFPKNMDSSKVDKKKSLGKQFTEQLTTLMNCLNKTEPHYIRCVKPNPTKSKSGEEGSFISGMCYEQLMYSGVFEAVSIRKQGFPFRLKHEEFTQRYNCIIGDPSVSNAKAGAENIINQLKFDRSNVQIGTTMILYRAEEHKKLELDRSIKVMTKEIGDKLKKLVSVNTSGMDKAAKEEYFDKLAHGVRQADEFRLKTPDAEKARKTLDDYIEARMDPETKRMLESSLKSMDKAALEAALAQAALHGYRTSLTRNCSEMLEKVQECEEALEASLSHISSEMLERSLSECPQGYDSPNVQRAREMLDTINQCISVLNAAQAAKSHTELQAGLGLADGIGYSDGLVEACRALFAKVMETRALLEAAIVAVDEGQLSANLFSADSFGYQDVLVERARTLYQRVARINEEVTKARNTLHDDHVTTCLNAANEIGMTTEWLEYFRGLVNGPLDSFLSAQFDKAVENKDHERAVRLRVKRSDLLVQEKASKFNLNAYQSLKLPSEWAKESGFLANKETLQRTFLTHQKNIIHSPLTRINNMDKKKVKQLKKMIRTSHETVQKFMGERKTKKCSMRVVEMLQNAVDNPEIRSETYIHILKQIDGNPDPQGTFVPKAWEMMALCLSTFPPAEDFENYLEVVFRSERWRPQAERWRCKNLLRRVVHQQALQNMRPQVPDVNGVENVGGYVKLNGFDDPPLSNEYDDLKQPFQGGGGQQYTQQPAAAAYQQPAAAAAYQQPAAAAPAPVEAPAEYGGPWEAIVDEATGDTYYYNYETGESIWELPDGFPG